MAAKKKEKIIWVDDGRTIADMSGVPGSNPKTNSSTTPSRYRASWREKMGTFFDAMGFMLLPTLAMVGLLAVAFLIVYILL